MDEVEAELRAVAEQLERIERSAVTKSDVFQAVAIVQSAWSCVIVGAAVVLATVWAI